MEQSIIGVACRLNPRPAEVTCRTRESLAPPRVDLPEQLCFLLEAGRGPERHAGRDTRHIAGGTPNSRLNARQKAASDS